MFRFLRQTALWILLTPLLLSFLGAASNQAVLIANGDKFPVLVNDYSARMHGFTEPQMDEVHVRMSPSTHLNALADIFDFHDRFQSVGDLLLDLGEYLWPSAPIVWGVVVIRRLRSCQCPGR